MSCSNCYNGCSEIISDKCVKYTGTDVPLLGIQKGDSLSYIEQTIIGFLVSTLDGSGIKPDMTKFDFCALVTAGLPTCGDVTILDIEQALSTAICTVNDLVTQLTATVTTINSGYSVGCLQDVNITDASLIHEILQALINRFCIVEANLTALTADVTTNYVKLADLNTLIQAYLDSIAATGLLCDKMVPYTAVEYYGPISGYPTGGDGFAASGAGYGAWLNVYLCNGDNGTPDKRGRVGVGVTNMLGAVPLDAAVVSPVYSPGTSIGANTVTLSTGQMPSHTHASPSVVTDDGHFHYEFSSDISTGADVLSTTYPIQANASGATYQIWGNTTIPTLGKSSLTSTGITVATTVASAGSSEAHNNYQPGLGCYYIIYIP
jgi:microcystin-dependent protein